MKRNFLNIPLLLSVILMALGLNGCANSTAHLKPVQAFDIAKYLGKWYEIARLENTFEKGLIQISAEYKARKDGRVDVINRGFNAIDKTEQVANGIAEFADKPTVGELKVSFFWPFYGGYKIIVLDKAYQYALITSDTDDYLWILARQPQLAETDYQALVNQAQAWGFNTAALIKVPQN